MTHTIRTIAAVAAIAAALAFSVLPLTSAAADVDGPCGPLGYCGEPLPPSTGTDAPAPIVAPETPELPRDPRFVQTLHGQDTRHCVSKSEFYSTQSGTRDEIEGRWETHSRQIASVPGLGRVDVYKRCGFSIRHAWYGAQYVRGTLHAVAWSNDGESGPTGLLRVS